MFIDNQDLELGEEVTAQAKGRSRRDAVVSVRLPIEEFAALEAECSATGKTMSQLIREALSERTHARRRGDPSITVFFGGVTTSFGSTEPERGAEVVDVSNISTPTPRTFVAIGS